MYFRYDSNNELFGVNANGTEYVYVKNLQGDVTGIADMSGNIVVQYRYDPWGQVESVTGSLANTLGQLNPMRYRGYYLDVETGYYYLQSRYYEPEMRRFINADDILLAKLTDNNLFSYCGNEPVFSIDLEGQFAVRADIIADAIDFVIFLVPFLSNLNKLMRALKGKNGIRMAYEIAKKAKKRMVVESEKTLSKLGIKIRIGASIASFLNYLLKASTVINKYFPFGLSIGGFIAAALARTFKTYTKYEKKWIWFGEKKKYTYIVFW